MVGEITEFRSFKLLLLVTDFETSDNYTVSDMSADNYSKASYIAGSSDARPTTADEKITKHIP